jgi:hypothetical protein
MNETDISLEYQVSVHLSDPVQADHVGVALTPTSLQAPPNLESINKSMTMLSSQSLAQIA